MPNSQKDNSSNESNKPSKTQSQETPKQSIPQAKVSFTPEDMYTSNFSRDLSDVQVFTTPAESEE
jgi:hypothetical protein